MTMNTLVGDEPDVVANFVTPRRLHPPTAAKENTTNLGQGSRIPGRDSK